MGEYKYTPIPLNRHRGLVLFYSIGRLWHQQMHVPKKFTSACFDLRQIFLRNSYIEAAYLRHRWIIKYIKVFLIYLVIHLCLYMHVWDKTSWGWSDKCRNTWDICKFHVKVYFLIYVHLLLLITKLFFNGWICVLLKI